MHAAHLTLTKAIADAARRPSLALALSALVAACGPFGTPTPSPERASERTNTAGRDDGDEPWTNVDAGSREPSDTAGDDSEGVPDDGSDDAAEGADTRDGGSSSEGPLADAGALDDGSDPPGGPSPEAILFEEDFEATSVDSVPSGWQSFVGYVVDANNTKQGSAYALVDATRAHRGTNALHVKGGQSPAMLTKPLPEGTNALYVRTWVWLTGSLGHAEGRNHETLLGVRKSHGGAHDEVRFGEIKGVIGVNEVPSDNISPTMEQWGKGPQISAGAWHCIEVAFLADRAQHEVRAWSDGDEVFAVNDPSQWQNGPLSPTFLDGKLVELMLGWHSFSSYENELWFDDVVVATERVGCD